MARIPLIEKADASPEVLAFYEKVAGWLTGQPGPRATQGALRPPQPWRALAHSPELANVIYEGSSYVLSRLPWAIDHLRLRQIIILAVTRRLKCEFAYQGHWPHCERAGVERAIFEHLSTKAGLESAATSALFTEDEKLLIAVADDLARTGNVPEKIFAAVVERWGARGAVEITAIVGYRMLTSVLINAFDLKDD